MGNNRVLSNSAFQIFIACLIPNLGSWVLYIVLAGKFDNEDQVKSFLEPPAWVVPVAWTFLFTCAGFSSWRVWKIGGKEAKIPLLVYTIKLLLNWLWPIIAFGLGSLLGAIIDTIFLQAFVVWTAVLFFRIDKLAGLLYIPYFLYLCYVLVLCTHIYILNY